MRTYDLAKSNLVISGVPIDATATEGISFDVPGQDWTELVDVSGGVTRSRTVQGYMTATLTVLIGGQAHAHLSRLREADLQTGRGAFPLYFRDWASGSEFASRVAYVRQEPTTAFAQEAGTAAWTIVMPSPRVSVAAIPDA